VTQQPAGQPTRQQIIRAFPDIGPRMRLAYRELRIAATGSTGQIKALGDPRLLPRPWDPATCDSPDLRQEIWAWLDQVVTWLNQEYNWDVATMVPSCWPQHPHLVHEIAVLADQRRRASEGLTSDPLEDWHRYSLPAFQDRLRHRLGDHCTDGHQHWPARGRHTRHTSQASQTQRNDAFRRDIEDLTRRVSDRPPPRPRLGIVDLDTGEITDSPP
jgi:hypothetical protein